MIGPGQAGVVQRPGTTQTLAWASSYYLPDPLASPLATQPDSREAWREAVTEWLGLGVVSEPAYAPDTHLMWPDVVDSEACTHGHFTCLADRTTVPLIVGFLSVVNERVGEMRERAS